MCAFCNLAPLNFFERVEALAGGRESVHEMHASWDYGLVRGLEERTWEERTWYL